MQINLTHSSLVLIELEDLVVLLFAFTSIYVHVVSYWRMLPLCLPI